MQGSEAKFRISDIGRLWGYTVWTFSDTSINDILNIRMNLYKGINWWSVLFGIILQSGDSSFCLPPFPLPNVMVTIVSPTWQVLEQLVESKEKGKEGDKKCSVSSLILASLDDCQSC